MENCARFDISNGSNAYLTRPYGSHSRSPHFLDRIRAEFDLYRSSVVCKVEHNGSATLSCVSTSRNRSWQVDDSNAPPQPIDFDPKNDIKSELRTSTLLKSKEGIFSGDKIENIAIDPLDEGYNTESYHSPNEMKDNQKEEFIDMSEENSVQIETFMYVDENLLNGNQGEVNKLSKENTAKIENCDYDCDYEIVRIEYEEEEVDVEDIRMELNEETKKSTKEPNRKESSKARVKDKAKLNHTNHDDHNTPRATRKSLRSKTLVKYVEPEEDPDFSGETRKSLRKITPKKKYEEDDPDIIIKAKKSISDITPKKKYEEDDPDFAIKARKSLRDITPKRKHEEDDPDFTIKSYKSRSTHKSPQERKSTYETPKTSRSIRSTRNSTHSDLKLSTPVISAANETPKTRRNNRYTRSSTNSELKLATPTTSAANETPQTVRKRRTSSNLNLEPGNQTPKFLDRLEKLCETPKSSVRKLTPTISNRAAPLLTPSTPKDMARRLLHVSAAPESLPCREVEFDTVYKFLMRKINTKNGGCMYISGMPGTGKTATVHRVINKLKDEHQTGDLSNFDYVEINSLRLTEPRQAYCKIWKQLTDKAVTSEQAQRLLDQKFNKSSKNKTPVILLVDELDYLCNRRQDVVYNILDWPMKQQSCLVVLLIANTMDLPERTLKGRVTSRMGLTRLVFHAYTYKQLEEIVLNRLTGNKTFHQDAVQLVARKVAAVSGDARRALDVCRKAIDMLGESDDQLVTVEHVLKALNQIMSSPQILAIRHCSEYEQMLLRAIRDELLRTGLEECTLAGGVYQQFKALCTLEGISYPSVEELVRLCIGLANYGLLLLHPGQNHIVRKISLNVSTDDVHFALSCKN